MQVQFLCDALTAGQNFTQEPQGFQSHLRCSTGLYQGNLSHCTENTAMNGWPEASPALQVQTQGST